VVLTVLDFTIIINIIVRVEIAAAVAVKVLVVLDGMLFVMRQRKVTVAVAACGLGC
jgi:hypothetical protein